jgi:hypothetical protein
MKEENCNLMYILSTIFTQKFPDILECDATTEHRFSGR